jgi:hypothetical protein
MGLTGKNLHPLFSKLVKVFNISSGMSALQLTLPSKATSLAIFDAAEQMVLQRK